MKVTLYQSETLKLNSKRLNRKVY